MGYKVKRYGWKPSPPDQRDIKFEPEVSILAALPSKVDMRPECPGVYDQGDLGSCTANAVASLVEFLFKKEHKPDFTPSRLFIYYQERALEGTINYDSGASLRDGMTVVNRFGAPHESLWPYNISQFKKKPTQAVYTDAFAHLVTRYAAVGQTTQSLKACLAAGTPIVGGFTVYSSFESDAVAATGIVPMPQPHEEVEGGHAICIVGYDDAHQWYIVRNSWGPEWGDHGYCYIPYPYFSNPNLSGDFWTATLVQ